MRARLAVALVMLLLTGCPFFPPPPDALLAKVRYEVEGVGHATVEVRYRLPSGESRTRSVQTPWQSEELVFPGGSILSIEATADEGVSGQLRCILASDEGAWLEGTIHDPVNRCSTDYELGPWPPDDLTGSLIRVG